MNDLIDWLIARSLQEGEDWAEVSARAEEDQEGQEEGGEVYGGTGYVTSIVLYFWFVYWLIDWLIDCVVRYCPRPKRGLRLLRQGWSGQGTRQGNVENSNLKKI